MKWFKKPTDEASDASRELYAATVMAAARLLTRLRSSPSGEESRMDRECRRAQELGQPLTVLRLELADWAGVVAAIGDERAEQTQDELELVLRGTLRATDLLYSEGAGSFTIFLPGTLAADLPTVTRNLRQAVYGYRILSSDGASFFLRLHPWIASVSLPDDGLTALELTPVLDARLATERQQPIPPQTEDDNDRPSLRLVA